jgi:hypothetical protein
MDPPGGYMPPPPMNSGNALQKLAGPAIGLMVTGTLSLLYGLYALVQHLMGSGQAALDQLMKDENTQAFQSFVKLGQAAGIFWIIGILVAGAFLIWGGLQMKQGRSWTISLVSSIVAMIPCVSCCFIVGIPIGIWALVILMKPDVKASFTA